MFTVTVVVHDEDEPTTDHVWSHRRYADAVSDAYTAAQAYYAAEHDLSTFDQDTLDLCLSGLRHYTAGPVRMVVTLPGTPRVVVTVDRDPAYAYYPRGWGAAA